MHRLLVDTDTLAFDTPMLGADAARHLKVLRPDPDESIELFDGHGALRVYRWNAAARTLDRPDAPAHAPRPEPLVLFACVTKGSRWDWTIEKATEIGVTEIFPVISDRTIVRIAPDERADKCARWRRIAEDAARQSDALWLPEIHEPMPFRETLAHVRATNCFVGALVTPPAPPLAKAVAEGRDATRPPAAFIGPEGDFTPEELAALLAIAHPASFGPTVLRAETAALFAVSVLRALQCGREVGS